MELFSFLEVMDSVAFKRFLGDISYTTDKLSRKDDVAVPCWSCQLPGTLAADDTAANQPRLSWGELSGVPDVPWEYSTGFRASDAEAASSAK